MENDVRLIDMNTLWQCETCFHHYPNGCDTYCDHGESYRPAVDQLTVIDPESLRPKGRWEHDGLRVPHGVDWFHCSECGKRDVHPLSNYCPDCGARMEG